jgi:group I intron endonuclease
MNSGLYLITNTINGKQYVGQSVRISKRFWRHKNAAKTQNPREAFHLHRAMAKYGIDNVRGGSYVSEILDEFQVYALTKEIWCSKDLCSRCGLIIVNEDGEYILRFI